MTVLVVAALCSLGCRERVLAPSDAPSVLLLTVDALRPDYMSINGYEWPTTPFLDSLISDGFYFEQTLAPVARTTPALASLLTGAYPHRTGVRSLLDTMTEDIVSIAELFHDDGYQTAAIVTNWVLDPARGLSRGFERYDTAHDVRAAGETTDAARRALERLDPEHPAFIWIHYIDPHVPYHPHEALAEAFDPDYEGQFRLNFGTQPEPGSGLRGFSAYPEDLPKTSAVYRNELPPEVNEHVRRLYAAEVRLIDDHVADLVASVRDLFGGNLLIVFTADHGESLGEHDFYFDHGDYVYNAGTRVPLALLLPEAHPLRGSGRIAGWVSLVDVVPTLLELLGREPPANMASQIEGRSLVPAFRGEPLSDRPVFAESGHSLYPHMVRRRVRNDVMGRFRAVTLGDWKLIWTPFRTEGAAWELYNVRDDPDETRDLYRPEHPEVAALKALLEEWVISGRSLGQTRSGEVSARDLEALRALGYVE